MQSREFHFIGPESTSLRPSDLFQICIEGLVFALFHTQHTAH